MAPILISSSPPDVAVFPQAATSFFDPFYIEIAFKSSFSRQASTRRKKISAAA
ncbi:hypothetical protein L3V64_013960 [Geobacillus stearothermophilus]|nr:hypothetical protein [Geobacillus stearothermophilus]MCK7607404.1 hypothetical protein [Geobacillus stearothermophilus]